MAAVTAAERLTGTTDLTSLLYQAPVGKPPAW